MLEHGRMPTDLTVRTYEVPTHLGRHLVTDPRSLAYCRPYDGQPLKATDWEPRIPVLDQQDLLAQGIRTSESYDVDTDLDALSSCTGNAGTALLSILLSPDKAAEAGLDLEDAVAAERFAIDLYADATTADEWRKSRWPKDDVGSSGLGIAKALHRRGLIDQYGHATTAEELCALLQTGPVLLGMPWLAAFTQAGSDGFIDAAPAWADSPLEGGHEVCVTALERVATAGGDLIPEQTVIRFVNSWSESWGDHGSGRLTLATYQGLINQIDVVQPRLDGVSL